jgi:hypothetical protein
MSNDTTTETTAPRAVEITETDAMRREVNRGLMVQWINADLLVRANHDVRTSVVMYDADRLFMFALPGRVDMTNDDLIDALADNGVRFYSRGIV